MSTTEAKPKDWTKLESHCHADHPLIVAPFAIKWCGSQWAVATTGIWLVAARGAEAPPADDRDLVVNTVRIIDRAFGHELEFDEQAFRALVDPNPSAPTCAECSDAFVPGVDADGEPTVCVCEVENDVVRLFGAAFDARRLRCALRFFGADELTIRKGSELLETLWIGSNGKLAIVMPVRESDDDRKIARPALSPALDALATVPA